jgi:hypothetical protein
MHRRVVTAALSVLVGALWASAASAAMSSAPRSAPTDHIANLYLGGVTAPTQDVSSFRVNAVSVARGFQLDLTHGRNSDPYGDVFPASASLNSAFVGGTNIFAGASFAIGRDVDFNVGHLALGLDALSDTQPSALSRDLAQRLATNLRSIGTTSASLNWNFADWGAVGLTASHSTGNSALLGGSLRNGSPADSSALGISARVGFAEGWVTSLTYAEGVTQLDLNRDQLGKPDSLRSEAYGIGLAKNGLFGDDAFGIALSRPLQIYTGSKSFGAPNTNFALANTQARESDVELGYVTTFLDGSLALQANAAYQVNAAGAKGQNAVAGVARAKLNF